MKNKMLVIFACMLLIAIVVLPVEGIINKNEVITYEHDVGVTGIISPTGGTLQIQEVEVAVKNYGNNSENDVPVNVVIEKDGGTVEYDETVLVDIGYGATVNVLFPDWMPSGNGSYTVTACTQLTGDEDPSNDCMSAEIIIGFKDELEMYIAGGFGVNIYITNLGAEPFNRPYRITISINATIMLLGKNLSRLIPVPIQVGETVKLNSGLVFGLGTALLVDYRDRDDDGLADAVDLTDAFIFGPFVLMKKFILPPIT